MEEEYGTVNSCNLEKGRMSKSFSDNDLMELKIPIEVAEVMAKGLGSYCWEKHDPTTKLEK